MSITQSPGLTKVSNWTAVAAQVSAYLEGRSDIPKGALFAIERYFEAALAGAREESPEAKAISCFSIAITILEALHPGGLTQKFVQDEMAKYLKIIQTIKEKGSARFKLTKDAKSLVRFLKEMEKQGNVEREGRLYKSDDDDD